MATHSLYYSCWRIPWTKEPGGLQSMESQRVGQDGVINTFACTSEGTSAGWGEACNNGGRYHNGFPPSLSALL